MTIANLGTDMKSQTGKRQTEYVVLITDGQQDFSGILRWQAVGPFRSQITAHQKRESIITHWGFPPLNVRIVPINDDVQSWIV